MATALYHARSSVRRWGGQEDDYMRIHLWFDLSKAFMPDVRHRAMRHHSAGILEAIEIFGDRIILADGTIVATQWVCEQHILEDLGRIPTPQEWLTHLVAQPWMGREAVKLERMFGRPDDPKEDPDDHHP